MGKERWRKEYSRQQVLAQKELGYTGNGKEASAATAQWAKAYGKNLTTT